jgi:PAS domain S-box-containing protein
LERVKEYIQQQEEQKTVGINDISADLNLKKREVIDKLRDYLQDIMKRHADGLTITQLTKIMKINRNWIAKQLDLLFLSGKVQRKRIGPAKVYSLSEDGLTKWEKYYLALLENSSDLIMVLTHGSQDNIIIDFVSQSVTRMLGFKTKDLEGTNFLDLVHPDEHGRLKDYFLLREGEISEHIFYLLIKNTEGLWRNLEIIMTDLLDDTAVNGLVLNCKDITETLQLEEQIQFRVVFEKFLLDLSTEFIDFPYEKIDPIISNGLSSIGKFFLQNAIQNYTVSPDQVSMYLVSSNKDHMICSHQWVASLPNKTILPEQGWDLPEFEPILSLIRKKDLNYFSDLQSYDDAIRISLETVISKKIKAIIIIPLLDQETEIIGFTAFEFFTIRETWTEQAIEMLQSIGKIMQSALRSLNRFIDTSLYQYFKEKRNKRSQK